MASDNEASCESDPNFAVICAFFEKFGAECGLPNVDFLELQAALENTDEVPGYLTQIILKLLRRVKRSVKNDKWEKTLVNVCHNFSSQDAWEIERFGFKKAKLSSKVRVLKEILEMQFDYHVKFKNSVNKLTAEELRCHPLGRDKAGHAYWFQSDDNYQIRVYKEDLDEETWTLIAKDRDTLVTLVEKLSDGDSRFSSDSAVNEDSNSLSEKPIVDTGQAETDTKLDAENSNDQEDKAVNLSDKFKNTNDKNEEATEDSKPENVNDLMGITKKRSRSDSDNSEPQQKILKVSLNKLQSDVVGESIEEPVMKIQGEGSGQENEMACWDTSKRFERSIDIGEQVNITDKNPIVGEVIEENVVFFYGEGTGFECLTGNEEKGPSNKTHSVSDVNTGENCMQNSSTAGSIKDNLSDNNVKAKEVPLIKLGTIIDTKTDNNVNKATSNPSKKSRWDVETLDEKHSNSKLENPQVVTGKVKDLVDKFENVHSPQNTVTFENKTPPTTPKKSTFFFGKGSFKSNLVSPSLTMGFGQNSPSKSPSTAFNDPCDTEVKENLNETKIAKNENNLKVDVESEMPCKQKSFQNEEGVSEHSVIENIREIKDDEVLHKKTTDDSNCDDDNSNNKVEEKIHVCEDIVKTNYERNTDKSVEESTGKEIEKTDKELECSLVVLETSKKELRVVETENQKPEIVNADESKVELEDITSESQLEVDEPECIKKSAYICGKESNDEECSTDTKTKLEKHNTNGSMPKEDEKQKQETENEIKVMIENNIHQEDAYPENIEKLTKNVASTAIENNSDLEHKCSIPEDEQKTNEDVKNCDAISSPHKEETTCVSNDLNVQELKPQVSLRSIRSKKATSNSSENVYQKVFVPSTEQSSEDQQEVCTIKKGKQKKKIQEKPSDTGSLAEADHQTSGSKPLLEADKSDVDKKDNDNTNVLSNTSSRANSPIPEALIVLPSSPENNADSPLKDPLANSDEEPTPPPKPLNLQSLSLDFNESSTPPPIPVIPSRRALRKRGREANSEVQEVNASSEKRMKLKGKRQVDTKLRKSIEQKKQQQVSSSDEVVEISDDEKPSKSRKKGGRPGKKKKEQVIDVSDEDSGTPAVKPEPKPKRKYNKRSRMLTNLGITDDTPLESVGVRQSRRLAQLKIKEQAEGKKHDVKPIKEEKSKKNKVEEKEEKSGKRKNKEYGFKKEDTPELEPEESKRKRKKKYKYKDPSKIFDESKPWRSSSESSEENEEVEEEEEEVIEEDDPPLEFKSDHEFSPESDLEDGESQPLRRARTARRNYEECDDEEVGDDCPCQKCGKSDHPEWILLCDKCDNGWHCSCLRPPLLVIPEGDWFCPPCQHIRLVESLQAKLVEYDKKLSKKEIEDRRKERLAYVGISLNNVLPSREVVHKKKRQLSNEESESSSVGSHESSESVSESDSDEPIYQLRQRRQAKSYKFNEYDDLIKSAIQDEIEEKGLEPTPHSRGKDMSTIVKAEEEERKGKEEQEKKEGSENVLQEKPPVVPPEYSDDDVIKPPVKRARKKTRRINNLDVSSEEDDERDEDFKGSSSYSEEEELDEEEDSEEDDSEDYVRGGKRRKNLRPVRRSTRARVSRYDADFINDDSDGVDAPRKKKKKKYWSETDSEESDGSWGGRGRKGRRKSKKKKSILDELSDIEPLKKKKPKIKYGGLTSSEEETGRRRRTRGKKTTYVDTLGSDSDEDTRRKKNPRRIDSDEDDEDFVANEEDEKDSEVQDEEVADEEDEEEEKSERRPLIVPKIYIKKPPVSKDVERLREKNESPPDKIFNKEAAKERMTSKPVENLLNSKTDPSKPTKENSQSDERSSPEDITSYAKTPLQPVMESHIAEKKPQARQENTTAKSVDEAEMTKLGEVQRAVRPVEEINKTLDDMDSDDMEKMMEEEEFANKQLQLVALQLEKEKKRKAEEAKRIEVAGNTSSEIPVKRGRKPKAKEGPDLSKNLVHEPIVGNVKALIRNDNDNDELSEPPGVALPLFEELASRKTEDETPKKSRGKGKAGKKSLEETLANLGGKKNLSSKLPDNTSQGADSNIEIAAPPQPFSQAAPTPSVITRMLQSKPGQTTTYPVGTIRPKQFATMPDDDDDSPSSRSRGSSPSGTPGHMPCPPTGQFMPGGPRGPVAPPFRPMHQGMNHYPRGPIQPPPSPHSVRGPAPPGMLLQMYHTHHRPLDPSPSGGGTINMAEPNSTQVAPPPTNSPGNKMEPHNYSRTPVNRFAPNAPNMPMTPPPRPMHMLPHMQQSRPNLSHYPPPPHNQPAPYYGAYPPENMGHEDAMPPTMFQNSPYPEQFPSEMGAEPSENSNSKSYGDESGGEFGGLVSYFSSQREDDLES